MLSVLPQESAVKAAPGAPTSAAATALTAFPASPTAHAATTFLTAAAFSLAWRPPQAVAAFSQRTQDLGNIHPNLKKLKGHSKLNLPQVYKQEQFSISPNCSTIISELSISIFFN